MKLKKKFQSGVLSFLERRYPGIRDIVNLLGNKPLLIKHTVHTSFNSHAIFPVFICVFKENVRERVAKQYVPGVTEVDKRRGLLRQSSDTFDKKLNTDSVDLSEANSVFKADDGKWRPVVVTLGRKLNTLHTDS